MNLPSDSFFGTCSDIEFHRNDIPQNLSVQVLGYYNRDNIKIDKLMITLLSPTWISYPLEFEVLNLGWTETNYINYGDGGVHLIKHMILKNPGEFIR